MTTKEYTLIQKAFYKHYKHDPQRVPGNYLYQFLKFERNSTTGEWGASYRALSESKDWWRPLREWFDPLPEGGKERYELIVDEQELQLCRKLLSEVHGMYYFSLGTLQSNWKEISITTTEKDLSDLTEEEAKEICKFLDLDFQSFLPRDATDYLPGKQKIKILGDGGYSTTVEIHESGQVIVFYGASEAPASDINTLPIIDYLRSRGYVFKY